MNCFMVSIIDSLLPKLMRDRARHITCVVILSSYVSNMIEIGNSIYVPQMDKLMKLPISSSVCEMEIL